MIQLVVGSETRLRFRFVDRYYDSASEAWQDNAVDLSSASDLKMAWSVNGVAQDDKSLTADADQTANAGIAYYDFSSGDISTAGELRARVRFTDSSARTHKARKDVVAVINDATP